MLLNPKKLERAIDLAYEISGYYAIYVIDPNATIRSTDYLRELCKTYLKKEIKIFRHKLPYTEGQPIKGFFIAYKDGSYEIALLTGMNYCWKRLVLCKELFHVVLDEEESRHKTVNELIDDTTVKIDLGNKNVIPSIPFQTELLAEIAAMEFLFPYKERKTRIDLAKASSEILDYAAIAEQYKLPRYYIEMYLSDSFMTVLSHYSLKSK